MTPSWRGADQPAAASYLLRDGAPEWIAFKLDVIRVTGGRIAETTTFDHSLFPAFGLPLTLPLSLTPLSLSPSEVNCSNGRW
jgi:hypothetical protein